MVRRMTFRNERVLYKDKCDLCGKDIISAYAPEKPFKVYCAECWWSDKWDAASYARDYDFSKPFFIQFGELLQEVPRMALESYQNENSPYSNFTWFSKNVHLSSSTLYSENVFYSFSSWHSTNVLDCYHVESSDLAYEVMESEKCSRVKYITYGMECLNSSFLYDCRGCSDCFMSSNLRNKSNVFRNEELSPEEYRKRMNEIDFGSRKVIEELIGEYAEMSEKAIHKFAAILKAENVSGDSIAYSKNAHYCFRATKVENVKYGAQLLEVKDSMDVYGGGDKGELVYEGVNIGLRDSVLKLSSHSFENLHNVEYCDYCRSGGDFLFGCAGLRKKEYCILNKQYSKEEYEALVPKIKSHMDEMPYVDSKGRIYKYGEFFPPELSPFAYNETIAQEFFLSTKEAAIKQGYRWRDADVRNYQIQISGNELMDNIKDVPDDIVDKVIGCDHEGKCNNGCTHAFKILKDELGLYRNMNIPLPTLCPNCRHHERLQKRNPLKLWRRQCMCKKAGHGHADSCQNEFETPYAPERPEIIYCEECYQREVV